MVTKLGNPHRLPNIWLILCSMLVATIGHAEQCSKGFQTQLQYFSLNTPRIFRLDQSIGQTQFILKSDSDGKNRFSQTYEGRWFCLGFNQATKNYLLGGVFQIGAWLPLGSIQYLHETTGIVTPSIFERQGYLANAAIVSPKGRYIAFIGGQQTSGQLYLLDTQTDTIKKLGPAPAPPPVSESFSSEEPFEWGAGWADGYVVMEPDILNFKTEQILQVSYGKDTRQARAQKRRIQLFKLAK